jgi:pimeloyl-ACP methyl ester carboxylesterase
LTTPGRPTYDAQLRVLRGLRVRVRVHEGSGTPLLLLNGLTRPLESWGRVVDLLPERTIVTYDAPGVGRSAAPVLPVTVAMLADIARSVLDQCDIDTVDVLGFSHGGAVAQQLAVSTPDRVRRLVLVSTSCGVGATVSGRSAWHAGTWDSRPWPRPGLRGLMWNSLAVSTWTSIPFLSAIRCPTLVVCGTYDRVVPTVNSALLARRIPDARLVTLVAGHDLQRPAPAGALVAVAEPFLAERRAAEPGPVAPVAPVSG